MKNLEIMRRYGLQLFAEGDGDGTGGAGDGGGHEGEGSGTGGTGEDISFDDFLGLGQNRAEFDRRVQKAIQTAVANAQKKWQTLTDDKVGEAEKLAQMTAEERLRYRAEKAEKSLADLQKQMARDDMAKTARKMLADETVTVPDNVVMALVTDDAESTKTAVQEFAKAFKEAVQAAVKDALRGEPPKGGTGGGKPVTREDILAVKDRAERRRLIAENPQLFVKK